MAGLQVLLALETYFISITNSLVKYNTGYNVLEIAGSSYGYKHSVEVKLRLYELASSPLGGSESIRQRLS
jgi:hypothetical protein